MKNIKKQNRISSGYGQSISMETGSAGAFPGIPKGETVRQDRGKTIKRLWQEIQDQQTEKSDICKAAVKLIKPGMTVIIDSGSTLAYLASMITEMNISVVTNSVLVINELANSPCIDMTVAGGSLRRSSMSLVNVNYESMFDGILADMLFMGSTGFSLRHGITTSDLIDAEIKKQMVKHSSRVCLLADSSKFEKVSLGPVCGWDTIDYLITDTLPPAEQAVLAGHQVNIITIK